MPTPALLQARAARRDINDRDCPGTVVLRPVVQESSHRAPLTVKDRVLILAGCTHVRNSGLNPNHYYNPNNPNNPNEVYFYCARLRVVEESGVNLGRNSIQHQLLIWIL